MESEPKVNEIGYALFILQDEYRNLARELAHVPETADGHGQAIKVLSAQRILLKVMFRLDPMNSMAITKAIDDSMGLDQPLICEQS